MAEIPICIPDCMREYISLRIGIYRDGLILMGPVHVVFDGPIEDLAVMLRLML